MKTIEEKAKAYEEALEKAKLMIDDLRNGEDILAVSDLESMFPQLKESEDDKIKKGLIKYFRDFNLDTFAGLDPQKILAWLEKQGINKLTDKVEPKFKIGDWCIDNEDGAIFQIVKVLDNTYTYKTNEGKEYSCTHYSLENDAKLWTIQDAKPGDILCTSGFVFQFKKIRDDGGVSYYCANEKELHEGDDSTFHVAAKQSLMGYANTGLMHYEPATEEQRDLLFQKMKETGYEWDAEKKELKKIEQNPSWSEEDELSCFESALFTAFSDAWQSYLLGSEVNVKQWAKEHSKELLEAAKEELKEQKPVDADVLEKHITKDSISDLANTIIIRNGWRIEEVSKPVGWSEDDEGKLKAICTYIQDYPRLSKITDFKRFNEYSDWLKSLKERYTWKPSDEQIKVCKEVYADLLSANGFNVCTINSELNRLEEQLKKLRGGGIVMKYCVENEIFGHLESIINGADRMTSRNFMHNKNAIKLSAKIIIDRLHSLGIHEKE